MGSRTRSTHSRFPALVLAALACASCKAAGSDPGSPNVKSPGASDPESPASSLAITSPAFAEMAAIPKQYTCEGSDTSPPLEWTGVPANTKSLALVVDDPDAPDPKAPKRVWVHWVVYNLPPESKGLAEGASASGLPRGAAAGKNDWGKASFGGPCPPIGRHRYFHKLYALDKTIDLAAATKAEIEDAMKGHVLGKAVLIGTYQKGE